MSGKRPAGGGSNEPQAKKPKRSFYMAGGGGGKGGGKGKGKGKGKGGGKVWCLDAHLNDACSLVALCRLDGGNRTAHHYTTE